MGKYLPEVFTKFCRGQIFSRTDNANEVISIGNLMGSSKIKD